MNLNPDFASVQKQEAPKVILFDLWRTLFRSADKEPILDLQEIFGHNMEYVDGGHLKPQVDPAFLRLCLTTNIREPERFLSHVAQVYGFSATREVLARFQTILEREAYDLSRYEDVNETIVGLKEKGYRLGIISNLWAFPERRIFVENNFGDHFEHRVYSFEIGHEKPEPEIFHEACKRFGVEAGDCLMVGDHPEKDVQGALQVGMNAALIDRRDEVRTPIAGVRKMRTLTELLELPSLKS